MSHQQGSFLLSSIRLGFASDWHCSCNNSGAYGGPTSHLRTAKVRKMIETLAFSVLIIAISIALLSVKLIFKKDGKFSSQHIHDNPGMKSRGIHCVLDQDKEARIADKAM